MADFDDYLTSQGVPQLPSAAPPVDSMPQGAQDTTPVSGVDVSVPRPQGMNYSAPDSVASQQNVQQSLNSPSMQPQGGGANPGIWGLLPQNIQHGTLRNVLGALGDAFLVQSGHQAQYAPRMERQKEGLAMADYADHPEMAIGRMAATGTPDAMKYATSLQENLNNADARKAALQQSTQYHQDTLAARKDALDARIAGQQMSDAAKAAQRGVSVSNNTATNRARLQAAGISANSKLPTEASQVDQIRQKVNAGQTLSAGDQAVWDKQTNIKKPSGASGLHSATTAAAGPGAAGAPAGAVNYLKQNPSQRAAFDAKYGAGASAKILGR